MSRFLLLPPLLALAGCATDNCLGGEEGCIVASPCEGIAFTCDGGSTEVYTLGAEDTTFTENDNLAAAGDVVLANDQVEVVIEALDHPHYISRTGGGIIDMRTRGQANDSLRNYAQATGVLPDEAAAYDSLEIFDEGDIKAVQVMGSLAGYPDVRIATRYEIRPCEPGVRIRTEIVNGTPDPQSWFLTDAWYFGDRGDLPFLPGPGLGYEYPSFGLSTLAAGFRDIPYMVAYAHAEHAATYATVACSEDALSGFHSAVISAVGPTPRIAQPRDWAAYERFVGVVDSPAVSAGVDLALELRKQLFGEPYAELSGTVSGAGGTLGVGQRASLLISKGKASTPTSERVPVTHVYPSADGTWTARVPANADYVVAAEAYGQPAGEVEVSVGSDSATAPALALDDVAEVTIDATIDGAEDHVLVFVVPSDDTGLDTHAGEMFGHFGECSPLLGNPHGPSPACNRVLVDGETTVAMPPGTYDFYAVAGPFSTLAGVQGVKVEAGTGQSVLLELETLADLQPEGTLSGDFHVHGGASFDSSIPDEDRVKAWLASRIQVIATTEHDTVWDYADAVESLGAADRMHVITGTESTGHILFKFRSDYPYPLVTGHWNLWPVTFDPSGAWRGASWDELTEPGGLFERQAMEGGFDPDIGIVELNHPIGGLQFGRNFGWISATGMSMLEPPGNDSTGQGLFFHTPDGSETSNADYDVQEVMNGTDNGVLLGYRAFWFYLLNNGVVRGGVANSDSHTLTENVIGTPRTLIWSDNTVDDFDLASFDQAMRDGKMIGTNGPILVTTVSGPGEEWTPSTAAIQPSADDRLTITVDSAPWVPVEEIRVIVNGEVVQHLTDGIANATDPFAKKGTNRFYTTIPLTDILPAEGDAWIVVEAGTALADQDDLDCDGIPDTGDNDGDGDIDADDVDTDGDLDVDADDLANPPTADEAGCLDVTGPLAEPPTPERGTPAWYFRQVNPNKGYPMSFTNPFLIDRDGDGEFTGVPR